MSRLLAVSTALLALAACTQGGIAIDEGTDTSSTGDTGDTGDTNDTGDTGAPPGPQTYTGPVFGTFETANGSGEPDRRQCTGEVTLVVDEGSVDGEANCDATSDWGRIEIGGPIEGGVDGESFDGTWSVSFWDDRGDIPLTGTFTPPTMHVNFEGGGEWWALYGEMRLERSE